MAADKFDASGNSSAIYPFSEVPSLRHDIPIPTHLPPNGPKKLPSKPKRPLTTLPPPKKPSKRKLPTCKKERICENKRVNEGLRTLMLVLHKELRKELDVNTWYFAGSDIGMKELDLHQIQDYNCELEKLAFQKIQTCKKALYSSKTHNSAVIRKHLGQEKVMAFLMAFSYWRNDKKERNPRSTRPNIEYDKLTWKSTSAFGCAVKQCKKRGKNFTLVDCKHDYETMLNVPGIAPG